MSAVSSAVNLLGPVCSSGYGVVACEVLAALQELAPVALFPIGPVEAPPAYEPSVRAALQAAASFDAKAPSLRIFHQWLLAEHVGKGVHAAFPIFELDRLTERERHHLGQQDLVFVASNWARGVLRNCGIRCPVRVAPLGVNQKIFHPRPLPQSATTTFLHCGKLEYRKGAYDILEAFARAFEPGDDVRLIFHVHNPFLDRGRADELHREFLGLCRQNRMAAKITSTEARLATQEEVAGLMAGADCGLFPARAEGWNLELSEMLAMGRHCVATDYSGHTEYAAPHACRLISVAETETAFDGVYFGGQGRWAKLGREQLDALIGHMRDVHREKQAGALGPNEAGAEHMKKYTWRATAELILEGLRA